MQKYCWEIFLIQMFSINCTIGAALPWQKYEKLGQYGKALESLHEEDCFCIEDEKRLEEKILKEGFKNFLSTSQGIPSSELVHLLEVVGMPALQNLYKVD